MAIDSEGNVYLKIYHHYGDEDVVLTSITIHPDDNGLENIQGIVNEKADYTYEHYECFSEDGRCIDSGYDLDVWIDGYEVKDVHIYYLGPEIEYEVKYIVNGQTIRTDYYLDGLSYSILDTINPTPPTGYWFSGWYCSADNKYYSSGATIRESYGDFSLTANFSEITYELVFIGNGADNQEELDPCFEVLEYTKETRLHNLFIREGYTFIGWNTKSDGSGTNYVEGQTVSRLCAKDSDTFTLYAQWTPNILTVNYYSNYADYGTWQGNPLDVSADKNVEITAAQSKFKYDQVNDLNNVNNIHYLNLSRTGYTATGYWGTLPNGGNLLGQDTQLSGQDIAQALGTDISKSSTSINVYAQWKRNFNIDFNGQPTNEIVFNGQQVKHLVINSETLF